MVIGVTSNCLMSEDICIVSRVDVPAAFREGCAHQCAYVRRSACDSTSTSPRSLPHRIRNTRQCKITRPHHLEHHAAIIATPSPPCQQWPSPSSSSRTGSKHRSSLNRSYPSPHSLPTQRQDPPSKMVRRVQRRREDQAERRNPPPRRPTRSKTPIQLRRVPGQQQDRLPSVRRALLLRVRRRQR